MGDTGGAAHSSGKSLLQAAQRGVESICSAAERDTEMLTLS